MNKTISFIVLLCLFSQVFTSSRFLQDSSADLNIPDDAILVVNEEGLAIYEGEAEFLGEWAANLVEEYGLEDWAITVNTDEGTTVVNAEDVIATATQALENAGGDVNVAATNVAAAAANAGIDVDAAIQAANNAGISVQNVDGNIIVNPEDVKNAIETVNLPAGVNQADVTAAINNALSGTKPTQESVTNSITAGL